MAASIVSGICLVLIFLAPCIAAAQGQAPGERKKLVVTVDEAVRRGLEFSAEVKEARAGIDASRSKQAQAEAAKWAQLEANIFGGPSPESELRSSHGIIDSKSTTSDLVINGAFARAQIALIQPLYTFGKISAFREAAARGIEVSEAAVGQKSSEVALQIKQIYYGYLLAKELREFVDGIRDELKKALAKAERQVEAGSPAATLSDVYKLRAFLAQVDKNVDEAEEGFTLAHRALRIVLRVEEGVELELADTMLTPVTMGPKKVEDYLKMAKEMRPEFAQLKAGIKAREALVDAAVADLYPIIYAAAIGDVAQSTNRDESNVPIITDPLQHSQAGIILGVRWHFDFGLTRGKIDEARAEYAQLLHKQDFAEHGIPLQVQKAYLELQKADKDIQTTQRGYREARRWLVTAVANFDLGVGDAKELADALDAYARQRADNFRAIYNQRLGLANLAFASGEAVRELSGRP